MQLRQRNEDGFERRVTGVRWLAAAAGLTLVIAGVLFYRGVSERSLTVRLSAGDELGRRHRLAEHLREAADENLIIELAPTAGSEDALQRLERGELDAALIQGGLAAGDAVRQVASLIDEPLHLLVREELIAGGINALRGKRINLGPEGRGTRETAAQVLTAVDLPPGDYVDDRLSYDELLTLPDDQFPDAIFVVSAIPSSAVYRLVHEHRFRLQPLPVGDSLQIRDRSLKDAVIPAFTYGYSPAVPPEPLHTPATRLLLVARKDVPDAVVVRLMECVFQSDFARRAELPPLVPRDVLQYQEYPVHSGTLVYLNREQPLIDGEFMEGVENLRSFLFSALLGLFFAWRWYVGRQTVGFERYLDAVSKFERQILLVRDRPMTRDELRQAHDRLTHIKSEALEQFCSGRLAGDEHLQSFLLHVADVRRCLVELAGWPRDVVAATDDRSPTANSLGRQMSNTETT